ncbi:MAG TPA: sulfotransferase [Rhodopila sp.]|uniref:sulfotransferase n=1 Tax=Rhodopila sp. TaxID=2480087 RepID=UPI002D076F6B|nr:sulfotransferase [Rhodopila sp.]HVY15755.1 sulfotransferase [Rhodopila sp.]
MRATAQAADALLDARQHEEPFGTVGHGRLLLRIMEDTFPTARLADAYFRNLEQVLRSRPKRARPGRIVIGLGSGRSGSTSLTALLATIPDSCSTHENPPLIDWTPHEAEVRFHIRRLGMLADHYSVVADVSHWWLNALDTVLEAFPDALAIGLFRNADKCAQSFMRVKGHGRGSFNHWAPAGNGVWRPSVWDRSYPSYPLPHDAGTNPDRVKYEMITRYVRDYNDRLKALATRRPDRIVLAPTEEFGAPAMQARILRCIGASGTPLRQKLNARTVDDGMSEAYTF